MQVDIEKLKKLTTDADKIFIKPEGEEVLVQLLDIQQQVEDAIKAAKLKLAETALKLNPLFTSIQADKIKVFFRLYGSKYKIDEEKVESVPEELFSTKTTYAADAEAIEEYLDKNKGKMPDGVIEPQREKQISFSLKREAKLAAVKGSEPKVHYR